MLEEFEKNKEKIAEEWREFFLSRYPIRPSTEIVSLFDECSKGVVYAIANKDFKDLEESLDLLMRYLATDSRLSAGGSIGTFFYLREIVLRRLKMSVEDLAEFDRRLNVVICKAFDLYMNAREDLYKIRFKQMEFELKAQMRQFEFCMKHCPYLGKRDEPPEGVERVSPKSKEHGDVDDSQG
ncbi:MAG: hypothetical protein DRP01_09685 [Archaeoglobales archaeon]|nr:MAG: hypothetical protein DRP01_09685 [Archaeoglobales archaeon]